MSVKNEDLSKVTAEWPFTQEATYHTPWGRFHCLRPLDFIQLFIAQLRFYHEQNRSQNPSDTEAELKAYEEIFATKSQRIANLYMSMNKEPGIKKVRSAVEYLKTHYLWEESI